MVVPQSFQIPAPDGIYEANVSINMGSLAFPVICKPESFQTEVVKYLNATTDVGPHTLNILLIKWNMACETFDVLPILIQFIFRPHNLNLPIEDDCEQRNDSIKRFHDFVDQLLEDGEMDYLFDRKDGE